MKAIKLFPMFNKRALVTRGATHVLKEELVTSTRLGEPLALDLSGIQSMTPSFLDQLLLMVEESLPDKSAPYKVLMLNSPAGLRDRMESIGRYHQLKVVSDQVGDWLIPDN